MKTLPYLFIILSVALFTACETTDAENSGAENTDNAEMTDGSATNNANAGDTVVYDDVEVDKSIPSDKIGSYSVQIGEVTYSIDIPASMVVENLGEFTLLCASQDVKDAQCFTMEFYNGKVNAAGLTLVELNNNTLRYKLEKADGDGLILEGYLETKKQQFKVSGAVDSADDLWFVNYLASFRLLDAPMPPGDLVEPAL